MTKNGAGQPIDLTTNDGLKAAAALDSQAISADKATYGVNQVKRDVTANGGAIDWTGLELGVYLLEETNSKVGNVTYKTAAPSLIFLPTTDPADETKWIKDIDGNYAVWVYPKNSLESNVKTVQDANKQVGDKITYVISSSIPAVLLDQATQKYNLKDFAFYDQLDPKLDLESENDVALKVGTTVLSTLGDFQVKIYPPAAGKGQYLYVYVTPDVLQKIAAAKAADSNTKVELTFSPKVTALGLIPNQAEVYKNAGEGAGKTTPPTNTPPTPPDGTEKTNLVVSAWGKAKITETDENGAPLAGAKFMVFKSTDVNLEHPLTVNGKDTFESDTQGIVVIDGLHVGDYADDVKPGDTFTYKLLEVQAPDGYELIHQPIDFTLTVNSVEKIKYTVDAQGVVTGTYWTLEEISKDADQADAVFSTTLVSNKTVVNIPVKPKLPLTGGAGVAIFGLLGLSVIAAGFVFLDRTCQRRPNL